MSIYTSEAGAAAVRERYELHLAAWPVPVRRHELDTSHGPVGQSLTPASRELVADRRDHRDRLVTDSAKCCC